MSPICLPPDCLPVTTCFAFSAKLSTPALCVYTFETLCNQCDEVFMWKGSWRFLNGSITQASSPKKRKKSVLYIGIWFCPDTVIAILKSSSSCYLLAGYTAMSFSLDEVRTSHRAVAMSFFWHLVAEWEPRMDVEVICSSVTGKEGIWVLHARIGAGYGFARGATQIFDLSFGLGWKL